MLEYTLNEIPETEEIIELYRAAGLPRPIDDPTRIAAMYASSDIVVAARADGKLVGVSRALADGVWCCYLADLAVDPACQKSGIGRRLVDLTRERAGGGSMVLLLSVPDAMEYYPKIGMNTVENGFIFPRKF
ncbi:MAG: GNAT family N-acetyltransferase [Acidobacteria bacterium]|nr:GNAT family N-acetyltransferase [Acidobacteriota bacterium]MBK8813063.1 GNAT family N-acetyltransferase [Acidobacteriota bacterium]